MKITKQLVEIRRVEFDEEDLKIIEKALDITKDICSQALEDFQNDIDSPKIDADILTKLESIAKCVRDYQNEVYW